MPSNPGLDDFHPFRMERVFMFKHWQPPKRGRVCGSVEINISSGTEIFHPAGILKRLASSSILKGWNQLAQGCEATLGFMSQDHYPERVESIPHIPFVKVDFVARQQKPKLILKRFVLMMLDLIGDVPLQRFDMRRTNGKGAITSLPMKIR